MSPQAPHDIRRTLRTLNHAKEGGNVSRTRRYFGVYLLPLEARLREGRTPYEMLREKLNLNVAEAKVE